MFCPSNERLQNLTEKTKLLAQKCTQQIRATNLVHQQSGCIGTTTTGQSTILTTTSAPETHSQTTTVDSKLINSTNLYIKNCTNGKTSLRYLCPCKKGTLRQLITKRRCPLNLPQSNQEQTQQYVKEQLQQQPQHLLNQQRTTKWYVKVIQCT